MSLERLKQLSITSLNVIKTLLGYTSCGVLLLFYPEYIPHCLLITFLGMFLNGATGLYCRIIWYKIDLFVCSACHRTRNRSISGLMGQYSIEGRRYAQVIEKIIDVIFFFQPNHCYEAYMWERSKGFVK